MIWNRCIEYWANHFSICWFARTAVSFACSARLALLACSTAFIFLLAHSLNPELMEKRYLSSKWLLFAVTNVFIMKLYLILFVFFYKHEYLLISLSTNSTMNCLAWLQTVSATFSNMPQFSRFKSRTVLGAKRVEEQWPQKACKLLVGNVSLQTCFFRNRKKCFFDLNWFDLI